MRYPAIATVLLCFTALSQKPEYSAEEKPVFDQLRSLRHVPDDQRAEVTKRLALDIRKLPKSQNKLRLAEGLVNLSTEGDFGKDTLREAATTLADTLRQQPVEMRKSEIPSAYLALAQLKRYEHVDVGMDGVPFAAAMRRLEADDHQREQATLSLVDLNGMRWNLSELRGKVVLLNFWATWCPPCRKEMPDIEKLYQRFKDQGFVVLAVTDEAPAKVEPFVAQFKFSYPILLDPARAASDAFRVEGIPKNFVFNREGKLVAQSIDMRTERQFLEMLAVAGLK